MFDFYGPLLDQSDECKGCENRFCWVCYAQGETEVRFYSKVKSPDTLARHLKNDHLLFPVMPAENQKIVKSLSKKAAKYKKIRQQEFDELLT